MNIVPAILITGATSSAKTAFVRRLLAAQPAAEHWALLDNDGGQIASESDHPRCTLTAVGGCVCCTGKVMLRSAAVRLLRAARPARLIIIAAGAAEPAAVMRALEETHLARAMRIRARLCVLAAQSPAAGDAAAQALWRRQMDAACRVVSADEATGAGSTHGPDTPQAEPAIVFALAATAPEFSASSRLMAS